MYPHTNFDFTLISGAVIVLTLISRTLQGRTVLSRNSKRGVAALLVFYLWLLFTLWFTPSREYSFTKAIIFGTLIIAYYTPLVTKINLNKFFNYHAVIVVVLSLWYLAILNRYISGSHLDNNLANEFYLAIGLNLGLLLFSLIYRGSGIFRNITYKTAIVLFVTGLIFLVGNRAAILFSVVLLAGHYLRNYKEYLSSKRSIRAFGILLLFIVIIVLFSSKYQVGVIGRYIDRTMTRITFATKNYQLYKYDSSGRLDHYRWTIKAIYENPAKMIFGHGVGSYSILRYGVDGRAYPHNLILELFFEYGLIGILIFACFIYFSLIYPSSKTRVKQMIMLQVLFLLASAMKTGTLTDFRILFGFLGLFNSISYQYSNFHVEERKLM